MESELTRFAPTVCAISNSGDRSSFWYQELVTRMTLAHESATKLAAK